MPRSKPRVSSPRSLKVSEAFQAFVLDQLEELGEVTPKRMFGGVGLYHHGIFFAILARDTLYFKTNSANRPDYLRARAKAFRPFLDKPQRSTSYFAVPVAVLESAPVLAQWARRAIVAGGG
jgi:DNA transformation protein